MRDERRNTAKQRQLRLGGQHRVAFPLTELSNYLLMITTGYGRIRSTSLPGMTWGNGVSAKRYREDRKVCWLEGDVSITLYVKFVASSGCPEDNLEICIRTGENCWRKCPQSAFLRSRF